MGKRKCLDTIPMWIDGKCYNVRRYDKRKYECRNIATNQDQKALQVDKPVTTKIHLPSIYYSKLEKFRSHHVELLQNDTNTIIKYPTNGEEGFLEISGASEESIEEAKIQMHSFIADIRNQLSALQFVGIPLLSEEIKMNFERFKEEILKDSYQGVEESIFQSALKLHLTIAVFTLISDQEKQEAVTVLEEIKNEFQNFERPLKIRVEGINCMNNDYSKVNVLYANASLTGNSGCNDLQNIANTIFNSFYKRGLCREYSENVKLHMTIMNTKYRTRREGTPKKRWMKRETFDATQIMAKYKNFYFGEAVFDTIHLLLMSSKGEDGFYESICSVTL